MEGIKIKKETFRTMAGTPESREEESWDVHVPAFIIPCKDEDEAIKRMMKIDDILRQMGALEK